MVGPRLKLNKMFKTKLQDFYKLDFSQDERVIRIRKAELIRTKIGVVEVTNLKKIGVIKTNEIVVFSLTCPHMGADLTLGRCDMQRNILQCPWHGYVYDLENFKLIENPNVQVMKKIRLKSQCFDPDRKEPKFKIRLYKHSESLDNILISL
jgi:nitrite reductase/ring-hydroxylating ferredoxin subunit